MQKPLAIPNTHKTERRNVRADIGFPRGDPLRIPTTAVTGIDVAG